jgi:hypothetical protein
MTTLVGVVVVIAGGIAFRAGRNRSIVHSLLKPDGTSVFATYGDYRYTPPQTVGGGDGLSLVLRGGQRVHGFSAVGEPSGIERMLVPVFGEHAFTEIYALYWEEPSVTDQDLLLLARVPNLRELHLSHAGISDAGLQAILRLRRLTVLDLSSTRLTRAGIAQLGACRSLRELDLSQTEVDDELAAELQAALPNCLILR